MKKGNKGGAGHHGKRIDPEYQIKRKKIKYEIEKGRLEKKFRKVAFAVICLDDLITPNYIEDHRIRDISLK